MAAKIPVETCCCVCLGKNLGPFKVLSSDIRFFRQAFIKERCAEVVRKIPRPPSCESPLKIQRYLVQLLAIRILIAHTALSASFYSLHTAVGNGAMNKIRIHFRWRNKYIMPRKNVIILCRQWRYEPELCLKRTRSFSHSCKAV